MVTPGPDCWVRYINIGDPEDMAVRDAEAIKVRRGFFADDTGNIERGRDWKHIGDLADRIVKKAKRKAARGSAGEQTAQRSVTREGSPPPQPPLRNLDAEHDDGSRRLGEVK